jgi:hypothetical protein
MCESPPPSGPTNASAPASPLIDGAQPLPMRRVVPKSMSRTNTCELGGRRASKGGLA